MAENMAFAAAHRMVDDLTLSVSEAAQWLHVDRGELERAAAAYEIPTVVLRGVHRLPMTWVERARNEGWVPSRRPRAGS